MGVGSGRLAVREEVVASLVMLCLSSAESIMVVGWTDIVEAEER